MCERKCKEKIPIKDDAFLTIFSFFVFDCPSCQKKGGGKKKKDVQCINVSAGSKSFRARGISKSLLTTILATIRRPLVKQGSYAALATSESIEKHVKQIQSNARMSDPQYDLIVYHIRTDMSEPESIYYYIRNAFAHGAFDVTDNNGLKVYHLEGKKDETIHAQMRLKEKTLEKYIKLAKMKPEDIKALRVSEK